MFHHALARLIALAALVFAAAPVSAEPAPLPEESVGAQAFPDVAFASVPYGPLFHVSPAGDDANPGRVDAPWRTMAHAVAQLRAGDTAVVHGGTYTERLRLSSHGDAGAPRRLVAAEGERPVIAGGGGDDTSLVYIDGSYWVLDGLSIDVQRSPAVAVQIQHGHHLVIRNGDFSGGAAGAGLYVKGMDVALVENRVHDFWTESRDNHGMLVTSDSARVLIQDNDSFGNSGDSFQCHGPDVDPGNEPPRDLIVEGNSFHEDRENATDVKTCERVTIRQNDFSGYRATATAPQGAAMVVHMSALGVLIEGNRLWNNGRALSLGGVQIWDRPVTDVAVRRNVIYDHTTEGNGTGDGLRIGTSLRVELSNNTIVGMPNSGIKVGDGSSGPARDTRVFNNVLADTGVAITLKPDGVEGFQSERNLVFRSGAAATFVVGQDPTDLAGWRQRTGADVTSVEADPMFVADPRTAGFYTQPGSPVRDAAIPTAAAQVCEAGGDLGALETCPPAPPPAPEPNPPPPARPQIAGAERPNPARPGTPPGIARGPYGNPAPEVGATGGGTAELGTSPWTRPDPRAAPDAPAPDLTRGSTVGPAADPPRTVDVDGPGDSGGPSSTGSSGGGPSSGGGGGGGCSAAGGGTMSLAGLAAAMLAVIRRRRR